MISFEVVRYVERWIHWWIERKREKRERVRERERGRQRKREREGGGGGGGGGGGNIQLFRDGEKCKGKRNTRGPML